MTAALPKAPTGIPGLDEITGGGLPQGRATLVYGGPGSGKTLLAAEFLVRGVEFGENGALLTFEESPNELAENTASLGFGIDKHIERGKLVVDRIVIDPQITSVAGKFDLEALFIRIRHAVQKVAARRIVLDSIETLFAAVPDEHVVRSEMHRLFRWLKGLGLTIVVTAEEGRETMTRRGVEEYVSDCVIALEQNIVNQVSTRRLRIVKYRGSAHGTNQFPFIIDEEGFLIIPITGARLYQRASPQRISTGVPGLDDMLEGQGPYRGTTILISGTAGTGKTTMAVHFVDAACSRGERCLYYSFEQSAHTIMRDTGELGQRLRHWVDQGLLRFEGSRPSSQGLDTHLASMRRTIQRFEPHVIVLDPITGFAPVGSEWEAKNMLTLLLDTVAEGEGTLLMTSLTQSGSPVEATTVGISSLVDTWIMLRDFERNGRRERGVYVLKSRGIGNAKDVRSYTIDRQGVKVESVPHGSKGRA